MVSHVDGLVQATQKFAKDTALIRRAHRLKAGTRLGYECCALHRRLPACSQAICSNCTVVWLMPKCACKFSVESV